MKEVRTRFAPSPTGFQHIGGFRTAFYAWLVARNGGGKFLLRVEDTDRERLVPGAIRFLYEELAWFGLLPDEAPGLAELKGAGEVWEGAPDIGGRFGPYMQSNRLPRYKEIAEQLIRDGYAYRCDCTPEMLEKDRAEQLARKELPGYSGRCRERNVSPECRHVVRFKMPQHESVVLNDPVKGKVIWDAIPLRDTVILKSDGYPTYHLAVVVDDHDMQISHVMRGEEWLSSAPLHLLIYKALKWEPPVIAHLPVILGKDGKKLSKRSGAVSSKDLREQGYLAEAILNYTVLIGWNPGDGTEQEIFSREDLIRKFSLERCNSASGTFDPEKLLWMNGVYIRGLSVAEFGERARPFIERAGLRFDAEKWSLIAPHIQERTKLLSEVPEKVGFLFAESIVRDMPDLLQKGIDQPKALEILQRARTVLAEVEEFTHAAIEGALRPLAEALTVKVGPMLGVLRIAVTGKKVTPPLFESLAALGKELTIRRIEETIKLLG